MATPKSVLVCPVKKRGCGFVGRADEFIFDGGDLVVCPMCREDVIVQAHLSNMHLFTQLETEIAQALLKNPADPANIRKEIVERG
jgi:uncharacterized protein YbaR (Trm112 family)